MLQSRSATKVLCSFVMLLVGFASLLAFLMTADSKDRRSITQPSHNICKGEWARGGFLARKEIASRTSAGVWGEGRGCWEEWVEWDGGSADHGSSFFLIVEEQDLTRHALGIAPPC